LGQARGFNARTVQQFFEARLQPARESWGQRLASSRTSSVC
jgi:hypothetical protein